MAIKVAHVVVITPSRCGLYETTRDLVYNINSKNIDARMVDPAKESNIFHPDDSEDRGAPIADVEWAKNADVIVNHSGLGSELEKLDIPIIHMAHGRPRSSFLSELSGNTPIYSYHYLKNKDPRFKAVVTFWPEHKPFLEVMWPDKNVYTITAPVDLEQWNPSGPRGYNFHGHKGDCNVVCTDAWRDDIDPFVVVNAFALYSREVKGAKLHIYGSSKNKKGWSALIKTIQDQGNMGECLSWVKGLDIVYRAADMLITPHNIAVRSMREAMACGCPVASAPENDLYKFVERMKTVRMMDRRDVREQAENLFNPKKTAEEFLNIIRKVKNGNR